MNSTSCEKKIKLFLKIWILYVLKTKNQIIFKNTNSTSCEKKNQIIFKNTNSTCCENKIQIIFKNMNSTCSENKKSNYF